MNMTLTISIISDLTEPHRHASMDLVNDLMIMIDMKVLIVVMYWYVCRSSRFKIME